MPVDLSIIIVHYKTPEFTLQSIESIYRYPPLCPFEVMLLDNGSNDGMAEQISQKFPEVRFIETGRNLGFGRANNLGIHNSRGDYVLLLNSDTLLVEPTLEKMIRYLQAHPHVGALGPRHTDGEGKFRLSCGRFPGFVSEILRKLWHYQLSLDDYRVRDYLDQKYSSLNSIDWVSGSCLMTRREVLQQVGLLDENFFMYFEDIDLCRRIQDRGWEIHFFAETSMIHFGGESVKKELLRSLVEYRWSQIYFARKYYGRLGEILVRTFLFLKYGVNLLKWGTLYALARLGGKPLTQTYTMALLAKKVLMLTFTFLHPQPSCPSLGRFSQNVLPQEDFLAR